MGEGGKRGPSVVITGAAGDLGQSLCQSFAADGYLVYAADVKPQSATDRIVPVKVDVSQRADVAALAARADEESHMKVWINAAGIFKVGSVSSALDEEWHRIIAVNLTGCYYGCAAALPVLARQGGGWIVNVGSLSGQVGGAGVHPAYGASKAGVHQLTRTFALEGARKNVLCNAVAPGLLEGALIEQFTPEQRDRMNKANPLKRVGLMSEVTRVIRFLSGPDSSYVNGAVVPINGGAFMP